MRNLIGFVLEKFRKEGKQDAGERIGALKAAARAGNKTEVARLLERPGFEGALRDQDGRSVLHHLVSELVKLSDSEKARVYDCIGLILAAGEDIDAADKNGKSPLADAVSLGDVKTVEFLLSKGADVKGRDREGKTPLHGFFAVSGPIYIKHINREVDLVQIQTRIAEMLIGSGADANAVDDRGCTPLALAVGSNSFKAVDFLLKNGADVNARDHEGKTPLHMVSAIVGDRSTPGQVTKMTEMLIQNGGDPNARDNKQRTPLFFARLDCMAPLLAAGADINARDEEGKTPIFCVKSQKCLEALIEWGADTGVVDKEGRKYND